MCACACVCVSARVCVCERVYACALVCENAFARACALYGCVRACVFACVPVWMCAYVRVCACVHLCACVCVGEREEGRRRAEGKVCTGSESVGEIIAMAAAASSIAAARIKMAHKQVSERARDGRHEQ